jgi:hypothetical protein
VSGSDWSLLEEGKSVEDGEPSFSTWDDVINKKTKRAAKGDQLGFVPSTSFPAEDAFYR